MDHDHIWCDLHPGHSGMDFAVAVEAYLGRLREDGRITSYRLTRRKLGLGPPEIGEFHAAIEIEDLAQLDAAFRDVSRRNGPIESLHHAVNHHAARIRFALYRDFPDAHRERGSEKF